VRASVARAIRMAQSWRAEVTVSNKSLFSGRNVLLSAQAVALPPAAGRNLNISYLGGRRRGPGNCGRLTCLVE